MSAQDGTGTGLLDPEALGRDAVAAHWDRVRPRREILEPLRRRVLGPLFARLGYDLVPALPEWLHRPLSGREIERLLDGAAERLAADFERAGLTPTEDPGRIARAFWSLLPTCPIRQRQGGNGFNGALQLFAVVRTLRPATIIESGVFRGFTTWVMRQAHPAADIRCFDPVLAQRRWRDPQARYAAEDWSTADLSGMDPENVLAFFDDHISQARRIVEAAERGIRRLLFDDDAAAHAIHAHGGPAFPTVAIILAGAGEDAPVRWLRNGREFVYRADATARAARDLIERAHPFDDLHGTTGYSPARLCYVALRHRNAYGPAALQGDRA
jgi:hypothetical protein